MPPELVRGPEYSDLEAQKEKVRDIAVAFIIPPSPFLADERVFPFLAAPKIAAELEKNGNPVEVVDLAGYANYLDIVAEYVQGSGARVIGLTATSPQIPAAVEIKNKIKEINPDVKVVLGGPHVTLTHGAMMQDTKQSNERRGTRDFHQLLDNFDKLVVGDGENAIFYAIDEGQDKVIDASGSRSPLFMKKGQLETYSFPARDLIDMDSYHYSIDGHRAFSLIAQLGCPFECGFCGGRDVEAYRNARSRNVESVISEVEEVVKASMVRGLMTNDPEKALTAVMFYDDELNVSTNNLENLCEALVDLQKKLARELPEEAIEQLGIKIGELDGEKIVEMRFRGFVKAELFTQKQADLMYRAGFRKLLTGVESGSWKILDAMRKHTTPDINTTCVEYAHNAGLSVKALMSIGHPGETPETIAESIEWAKTKLKQGDEIDWTIITQYPGSPYYDKSIFVHEKNAWLYQIANKKSGKVSNLWSRDINYLNETHYYKGIPGAYTAYVWTDEMSPEDLVRARDEAEIVTRQALNLPEIQSVPAMQFEHSMGQGLPTQVLQKTQRLHEEE